MILENENDKLKVINNLANLKENKSFGRISVTDDYTITERALIKMNAINEVSDESSAEKLKKKKDVITEKTNKEPNAMENNKKK